MRTKRIELEGSAGSLTIERPRGTPGSSTIRIDSIIRDPKPGEQTWKTWHIEARIDVSKLLLLAEEIQRRCDGVRGTTSDVDGYYRELQRFVD